MEKPPNISELNLKRERRSQYSWSGDYDGDVYEALYSEFGSAIVHITPQNSSPPTPNRGGNGVSLVIEEAEHVLVRPVITSQPQSDGTKETELAQVFTAPLRHYDEEQFIRIDQL